MVIQSMVVTCENRSLRTVRRDVALNFSDVSFTVDLPLGSLTILCHLYSTIGTNQQVVFFNFDDGSFQSYC